jgi:hypothetical protein
MKLTIKRIREIIGEELMRESDFPPDRTGLSAGDWEGVGDPRGPGTDAFPVTEPERLGELLAAAMEGGIRDVLQSELGEENGIQMFDRYLSEVDEDILRIAMVMRDHALELTGEPEGVVSLDRHNDEEELEL